MIDCWLVNVMFSCRPDTQCKLEGFVPVYAAVKLLAAAQLAGVVHGQLVSLAADLAAPVRAVSHLHPQFSGWTGGLVVLVILVIVVLLLSLLKLSPPNLFLLFPSLLLFLLSLFLFRNGVRGKSSRLPFKMTNTKKLKMPAPKTA